MKLPVPADGSRGWNPGTRRAFGHIYGQAHGGSELTARIHRARPTPADELFTAGSGAFATRPASREPHEGFGTARGSPRRCGRSAFPRSTRKSDVRGLS